MKFDCSNGAEHSHIADGGMILDSGKTLAVDLLDGRDALEYRFGIEDLQARNSRRTSQWVSRIGVAVKKSPGTVGAVKSLIHLVAAYCCGKGEKAAGQSF